MKKITMIIAIFLCFSIVSCENAGNFYCVKTIKDSPTTNVLSKSEMDVIKSLFNNNHLNYKELRFTRLQKDELGHHHVRCYQFINNLKVFTSDLIFHFDKNNRYYFLSGDLISAIDLNTKPSMNQDLIVEKFINALQDNIYIGDKEKIINGCFNVEFGYYDLNAGIGYADAKFTKAWLIKPRNQDYPFAYINDKNSEVIYYDNGIRY